MHTMITASAAASPASIMKHIKESKIKESILVEHSCDTTPLRSPLFPWTNTSNRTPSQYLKSPGTVPFGKRVAEWQKDFFNLTDLPKYRLLAEIEPIRPTAPTMVALFYHHKTETKRTLDTYLERMRTIAKMGEQTIIYVPPELSQEVRNMRMDKHWYIIGEYETIWDMPPNKHQRENFSITQPDVFAQFHGWGQQEMSWKPNPGYSRPHLSASYNAKAFITYDAVVRNPFGSERWMYIDAGVFEADPPVGKWGDLSQERLDEDKFDRSISLSGDTGIVMGEYPQSDEYGALDINHECWSDPKKAWQAHHFIAHAYVGSSLGMLNYSVRYMQTVDDADASGWYSGREEFLIPWVAIRYPNTVFSIPHVPAPGFDNGRYGFPMRSCYTTYGGSSTVPAIVDPISTLFCKGYIPRHPNLAGDGLYKNL